MRDDKIVDQTEKLEQSVLEEKERDKSNTFNIIIGVSTLLIAILGATFAYFSATATSKENDVTVQSAYVSISYDGGTEIKATNLIPATQTVALTKFKKQVEAIGTVDEDLEFFDEDAYKNDVTRRCIDSLGREVCYVYQFSIDSDGEADMTTAISGYIKINKNEFENLSYLLYEVKIKQQDGSDMVDKFGHKVVDDENGDGYTLVSQFSKEYGKTEGDEYNNIDYKDTVFAVFDRPFDKYNEDNQYESTIYPVACLFGFSDDYEDYINDKSNPNRCASINVTNKVKHTYQLVIWLEETNKVQNEQGKLFQGTVAIEVPNGVGLGDSDDSVITGKE